MRYQIPYFPVLIRRPQASAKLPQFCLQVFNKGDDAIARSAAPGSIRSEELEIGKAPDPLL